jgi:aryl-alcohol dehydrogenase-like predicted oxidoreductase
MPPGVPGQDYGNILQRSADKKVGTIIIRALAGGAMAGTEARHELAMQVVPPIGSGKDLAADVARARTFEGAMRSSGSTSLAEYGMRFVISNPNVSTMLVGYSNMDQLEQAIAAVNKGKL